VPPPEPSATLAQPLVPITPQDNLLRRIVPNGHLAKDGRTILRSAFMRRMQDPPRHEPDPELSVEIERLSSAAECAQRAPRPGFGVCKLSAQVPIDMNLTVRHVPLENYYAHAQVEGLKSPEQCQDLADAAILVLPPSPQPRPNF
jgi:hypothetical protein